MVIIQWLLDLSLSFSLSDFLWLSEEVLLTCSKDGKLVQQLFSDAQRPIEKAVS